MYIFEGLVVPARDTQLPIHQQIVFPRALLAPHTSSSDESRAGALFAASCALHPHQATIENIRSTAKRKEEAAQEDAARQLVDAERTLKDARSRAEAELKVHGGWLLWMSLWMLLLL